jgi:hypothetical protein
MIPFFFSEDDFQQGIRQTTNRRGSSYFFLLISLAQLKARVENLLNPKS